MSGTSSRSTTGSAAVCTNISVRSITPPFSNVSLKKMYSSNFSPMPPRMMMSASACRPMRASSSLYGSPASEKIGSFWLSTSGLNTSIIGMRVSMKLRGMMRRTGLTDGPPMSIDGAFSRAGLPSMGSPEPVKMRPSSWSVYLTCMGWLRNRTVASVLSPLVPANTCIETLVRSMRMTCASVVSPLGLVSSASSPKLTPSACTSAMSPTMLVIPV